MRRSARHAATTAAPPGWVRMAARPGSGIGFLPAALSVQPFATMATLLVAGLVAALAPRARWPV